MGRIVTPLLTVDAIIEIDGGIVLIKRKNPPYGWALPGGFVDVGETVEAAAIREAKEETSLDVSCPYLIGVYSDPKRDPRGHTVSVAFAVEGHGILKAADDATEAKIFRTIPDDLEIAFDHRDIIADWIALFKSDAGPSSSG